MARDVRRFVELIYSRDPDVYDRHGIEPPRMSEAAYAHLARQAFGGHALLPLAPPEKLLEAEGFILISIPSTRCGVSTQDVIAIRRERDKRLAALLLQHERTHGWIQRLGWDDYTESDVWLATAEVALPGKYRQRGMFVKDHPYLPGWFLALALEVEAA
jgi:hypothetical protein